MELDEALLSALFMSLITAPEGQLSPRLRGEVEAFWGQDPKPSLVEQYDFMIVLSRTSCHESSAFIKHMCALDRYYDRPGGPRSEPYPKPTICCSKVIKG